MLRQLLNRCLIRAAAKEGQKTYIPNSEQYLS
jgi:hypothetical protein